MKYEFDIDELMAHLLKHKYGMSNEFEYIFLEFLHSKEIKELKLEAGEYYKTRSGKKVFIYGQDSEDDGCIIGMCCESWYKNGNYYSTGNDDDLDIVDYWNEE